MWADLAARMRAAAPALKISRVTNAPAQKVEGEAPVLGAGDDDGNQEGGRCGVGQKNAPAGVSRGNQGFAEEGGARDSGRAGERPDGEGRGGEKAVEGGEQERGRVQAELGGNWELVAEQGQADGREGRACGTAENDACAGDGEYLQAEDGGDQAFAGAEAAQDGDGARPALQPGANASGDANAADQKDAEAHENEEEACLVDGAAEAGFGMLAVAYAPAGVRETGFDGVGEAGDGLAGRQKDAPLVGGERAWLDEAGGWEGRSRDHGARAEDAEACRLVGLAIQSGGEFEAGLTQANNVADVEAQAVEDDRVHGKAGLQGGLQRDGGGELGGAYQGVGLVHGFEVHEQPLAGGGGEEGAQGNRV